MGETVIGKSFAKNFGGKGANQAVQCARLGVNVSFCGKIGKDAYGNEYRQQLLNEGVNVRNLLESTEQQTGIASITVGDDGSNTIIIIPGSNYDIFSHDIDSFRNEIAEANVLICQNELISQSTRKALNIAREVGTISILNPAPVNNKVETMQLISLCDIVCPNEVELSELTTSPVTTNAEIVVAARKLLTETTCKSVIVTLGARGACIVRENDSIFLSCDSNVKAIDTVGAGDSFIGTMASNIARGSSITESVRKAIHCASVSVTRYGAQVSYPRLYELEEEYQPKKFSNIRKLSKLGFQKIVD